MCHKASNMTILPGSRKKSMSFVKAGLASRLLLGRRRCHRGLEAGVARAAGGVVRRVAWAELLSCQELGGGGAVVARGAGEAARVGLAVAREGLVGARAMAVVGWERVGREGPAAGREAAVGREPAVVRVARAADGAPMGEVAALVGWAAVWERAAVARVVREGM